MSFSANVKQELSKMNNYNKDILGSEFVGYCLSGNTIETENCFEFITENEFNIEHLYKILFNLEIEYEPEIKGKFYIAQIDKKLAQKVIEKYENIKGDFRKNIVKGAFLGAGSVNNPEKNYHLEISFNETKNSDFIKGICKEFGVNFKQINVNEKYQLYLKEGEEISRFLALIGANRAVLKFEDVRVMKEMKNNVNRKVNCETANLNKTVDAAIRQIEDINFIKKMKKFDDLPNELKDVAILRLENPDLSLKDLSELIEPPIGKSGINRRLKKIHEFAEELK